MLYIFLLKLFTFYFQNKIKNIKIWKKVSLYPNRFFYGCGYLFGYMSVEKRDFENNNTIKSIKLLS